jgi:hypothetical protein
VVEFSVPKPASLTMLLLALGCAPVSTTLPNTATPRAVRVDMEEMSECKRPREDQRFDAPLNRADESQADIAELPVELRRVATAAGLESLLATLVRGDASDPVATKLQLVLRLSSLEIQVASLVFEAQCTGARMDATLRELDRRRNARDVGLTVSSILVGALVGTAGGIWELRTGEYQGPLALAIGGGVASAALGLATFVPDQRAVLFTHERNLLTPIVSGEDPDGLYPSFVFRMLSMPNAEGGPSIREQILADWKRLLDEGLPDRQRVLAEAVLYGEGGVYDERLLDLREQMFDVLESHINAIDQELNLLYRYSARLAEVGGE